MARVGGRNAVFAWIVGILCAATVGGLAYLAIPMVPVVRDWAVQTLARPAPAPQRSAPADAPPIECRDLYADPLWASLVWAPQAMLAPAMDATTTTAAVPIEQAQPTVRFTCRWSSTMGTISTTLADVAPDAGATLAAALPGIGYRCTDTAARTRCVRVEGDVVETVVIGEDLLLSSVETAWHPERYAARVADHVWGR